MPRPPLRTLPIGLLARSPQVLERLWFLPSVVVLGLGSLSVLLVELDRRAAPSGSVLFGGDAGAARTVFTTLAGSLITVAALTFSVTVVVLQLASSQFSPRLLPSFLGDRMTQATVGTFVGLFVYALIGLRSVSADDVPRLTVTVGSALGVLALILLVFFVDHISRLIQVSESTARIGRRTLAALDTLYPSAYGDPDEEVDTAGLLRRWSEESEPGVVEPGLPGYVRRIRLDDLARGLQGVDRLEVCVCPGDTVSIESPLARIWPAESAAANAAAVRSAIVVSAERTLAQDAAFGFRQLADIALRAISPGINDPTTAVTCVVYLRSALARLAGKRFPNTVRRFEQQELTAVVRRREFHEYAEALVEIGRYANGDTRVLRAVLEALESVAGKAVEVGAFERARVALLAAEAVGERALAHPAADRDATTELLGAVRIAAEGGGEQAWSRTG